MHIDIKNTIRRLVIAESYVDNNSIMFKISGSYYDQPNYLGVILYESDLMDYDLEYKSGYIEIFFWCDGDMSERYFKVFEIITNFKPKYDEYVDASYRYNCDNVIQEVYRIKARFVPTLGALKRYKINKLLNGKDINK